MKDLANNMLFTDLTKYYLCFFDKVMLQCTLVVMQK